MRYLLFTVLCLLLTGICSAGEDSLLQQKIEQVHQNMFKRFVRPDGTVIDYAGLNGEVILPSPEECTAGNPNQLAWWTPIENGGFFGGIYLIALCERYEQNKTAASCEKNKAAVKHLVKGLYRLSEVGITPGFIARGVGSDGKCHYAASSDDQNIPFIMGLYRYLQTDIPSAEERTDCKNRLIKHIEIIRKNNWKIAGDKTGFTNGDWLDTNYLKPPHILAALWIMDELTGDPFYRNFSRELMSKNTPDGKERRKNLLENVWLDGNGQQAWIVSTCQYGLRLAYEKETEPELKAFYRSVLQDTAKKAVRHLTRYKNYDREHPKPFSPDWHQWAEPFNEQKNADESRKLAAEQHRKWYKFSPQVTDEKRELMTPFAAALIIALSTDKELIQISLPEIKQAICYPDYDKLYYASFFYAENAFYTLQKEGFLQEKPID